MALRGWSHRGMSYFTEERVCSDSRHFAELPFSKTWQAIKCHLATLEGTSYVSLTSGCDERSVTYLIFGYLDHEFCIHSRFAQLIFSVADPLFPSWIPEMITRHFGWLLAPGLDD